MKCLLVTVGFFILLLLICGCTTPGPSSVSGRLTVVTLSEGSNENVSFSMNETSDSIMTSDFMIQQDPYKLKFVPDEIIIKYTPGFDPYHAARSIDTRAHAMLKSDSDIGRGVLGLLKFSPFEKALLDGKAQIDRLLGEIEYLKSLPYVEYAEPNYIYRALFTPNDVHFHLQWHYPLINLDRVWEDGSLSELQDLSSITVAVIDTGVARYNGDDHPDLEGIFRDEYDLITDTSISLDGDGVDPDATDPEGIDTNFHGTHVIGTIGALTNNNLGGAGIAGGNIQNGKNGVRIMPLRVLGKNGIGTAYDIAQAIRYAALLSGLANNVLPPSTKADIINLSLGSNNDSTTIKNAVSEAYSASVIMIASAGNSNSSTPLYPAAYSEVISVSAVNPGAEKTYYSNYGTTIDLAAPGGDMTLDLNFDTYVDGILSTLYDENGNRFSYSFYQGTSMAAPHVSGIAAMVKKALMDAGKPTDLQDVKDVLFNNAIDLSPTGKDNFYGYGLVDAYAAIMDARWSGYAADLFPFPTLVKMEGNNPSASVTLKNIGDTSQINIVDITVNPDSVQWLGVGTVPDSVDDTGNSFDLSIDTDTYDSLTDGSTHTAYLEIQSNAGTEYVYVLYNINGFSTSGSQDIGVVYVVARDPDTYNIVNLIAVTYADLYTYTIENLKPGRYIIGASTDRDNDGELFEMEDAYGYYINRDNRVILDIKAGQNLMKIDFQLIDQTQ